MEASDGVDRDAMRDWMMAYLATITGRAADAMDPAQPLSVHDLDSVDAVEMALELEKAFGVALNPETFLNGDASIESIADALGLPSGPAGPRPLP